MSELEGIGIRVSVNKGEVTSGIAETKLEVKSLGNEAETAATKVQASGAKMEGSVKSLGNEAETAATKVQASGAKMEGSFKSLALGMSQVAASAFSLYQSVDNIEKKQYALEKANLAASKATVAVNKAQLDYNTTVSEYGPQSDEAALALERLEFAQETERLAAEKADMSQGNLNDSMMMAGLTVIPAVISGIDGMSKVWSNLKNLDMAGNLTKMNEVLALHKGALISAGEGLAAVAFIYGAFTTKSEDTRIAMSLLAGGLIAAASAQWVWNAATAFGLGLTGVGLALVGVGAAAAATVYVLSSQYGAKIEDQSSSVAANAGTVDVTANAGVVSESGTYTYGGKTYTRDEAIDIKKRADSNGQVSAAEINFLNWMVNNHRDAFSGNGYAEGGISISPQLATVSERGQPEIHLTKANIEAFGLRGGNNVYITLQAVDDPGANARAIAAELRREGVH